MFISRAGPSPQKMERMMPETIQINMTPSTLIRLVSDAYVNTDPPKTDNGSLES